MEQKLKTAVITALDELIASGKNLPFESPQETSWTEEALDAIRKAYSDESQSVADEKVKAFRDIRTRPGITFGDENRSVWENAFALGMEQRIEFLKSVKKFLERY